MTKLVIVESNAKCKKIEKFLGQGYKCVASYGHLTNLPDGLKSLNMGDNYKPKYKIIQSKSKYIKILKDNIKKAEEVILATDDDREGEAIAWHICQLFGLSETTTKRIKFNEITKKAVLDAVENHTIINMNKVKSQQARQILDLLVGYTLSPILWKHISRNSDTGLSAGRCQTPATRLLYDREKEIKENVGKKVYDTIALFKINDKISLEYELNSHHKNEEVMEEFLEKSVNNNYKLYKMPNVVGILKNPPKPFTTSLLQQKSSNELNYSPKQTMRLAQTLYENGWITYMRTDCGKYSKEFIKSAMKYVKDKFGKGFISKKIDNLTITKIKTKKNNAQEAHEAIRPTDVNRCLHSCKEEGKITSKEIRLYKMIWNNTMESLMAEAKYNKLTSEITAPDNKKYKRSEENVIFPGWKVVRGYDKANSNYELLMGENDLKKEYTYEEINSKVKLKELKCHYTEAKLVQILEDKGIGRPSTFSSLIDKIQSRKYVLKQNVKGKMINCKDFRLRGCELEETEKEKEFGAEKNKLVLQPLGAIVIEFLIKNFSELFEYDYTKKMEDELDIIEKGNKIWHSLCKECDNMMGELASKIKNKNKKIFRIDENHVYMIGRYGPVIKYEKDGETKFKNVKKNLDIKKLEKNEYKLKDILEERKNGSGKTLGLYKNKEVILKEGKFGLYINYDGKNKSVKYLNKDCDDIELNDVIEILNKTSSNNPNVLKQLNDNISIRKGKYGPYIMHKTKEMTKPKFYPLKGLTVEQVNLEWVLENIL